jgi:hypothetical protein
MTDRVRGELAFCREPGAAVKSLLRLAAFLFVFSIVCLAANASLAQIIGGGVWPGTPGGGNNIAFVASADLGNNGGGGGSVTTSYTADSGSNRLLGVCVNGAVSSTTQNITGVTYNAVTMTLGKQFNPNGGVGQACGIFLLQPREHTIL